MSSKTRWLWLAPAMALAACSEGTPPGASFEDDAAVAADTATDDTGGGEDVVAAEDVVKAPDTGTPEDAGEPDAAVAPDGGDMDSAVEPDVVTDLDAVTGPDAVTDPDVVTAPDAVTDPDVVAAPDAVTDPDAAVVTDTGPTCMGAQTLCGGACVDVMSDNANCGACGSACAMGTVCRMGACVPSCGMGEVLCGTPQRCANLQSDSANCGACGTACPAGQMCVAGACAIACSAPRTICTGAMGAMSCVDLASDNGNCGSCGTACPSGQSCMSGSCRLVCPTGQTACGTSCVDTLSDNANCGSCGNRCGAGTVCRSGSCQMACPAGQTLCGTSCVDTRTSEAHCGMCNVACAMSQTCQSGTCACPSGQTLCSGRCLDTQTDVANCGACGRTCPMGQNCADGTCRATGPANDLPGNATALNLATPVVTVRGSTVGAANNAMCRSGGDVFYRFTLTRREVVAVDTFGSSYDSTVAITNATGAIQSGLCSDDTCGTNSAQVAAVLNAGTYYIAVGGFSGTGNFVLNVHHLPVGNGAAVQITDTSTGVRTFTGTTSGTGTVAQSCGANGPGPENTYWFTTCPNFAATPVTASVCGGATWDTVVEQRSSNRSAAVCVDDTAGCGVRSVTPAAVPAGAGLHTIYVDSYRTTDLGAYGLAVSFGNCATGQNLCSTGCRNLQTDAQNCGACGNACAAGQACNAGTCGCPAGQTQCGGACVDTRTSLTNCGACGRTCTAANGTPACTAGACAVAACNAGFGNCDNNAGTGCEANLNTSNTHCGACGNVCGAGTSCVSGTCRPVNDLPANATTLSLASATVSATGSTVGATNNANCRSGGDVFYRFTLTRREVVEVDTFGSSYDSTVAITNATGAIQSGLCSDDTCSTNSAQVATVLNAGTYYIAVGGFSGTGSYRLTLRHLPVGGGTPVQITDTTNGTRIVSGTTAGGSNAIASTSCQSNASGPDTSYWFITCPAFAATPFNATTCSRATWDTILTLQNAASLATCADDSCGRQSTLNATIPAGAGLFTLNVDGWSGQSGTYSVSYRFGP